MRTFQKANWNRDKQTILKKVFVCPRKSKLYEIFNTDIYEIELADGSTYLSTTEIDVDQLTHMRERPRYLCVMINNDVDVTPFYVRFHASLGALRLNPIDFTLLSYMMGYLKINNIRNLIDVEIHAIDDQTLEETIFKENDIIVC